jgi:Zn-dependent peptidase ImmA (M78 family)
MSEDYRVNRRLDHLVREIATRTKVDFKAAGHYPVNVTRCLESGWILTDFGRKRLIFKVVDDKELGDDDGRTELIAGEVQITVRRSVYENAKCGDGRSRMTLAHELGHAVMHPGASKFRSTGATGTTTLSRLRPTESAEHQAKVFASAFLIDDETAKQIGIAEEVSVFFLVSLQAAQICLERIARENERAESAKRVEQINEVFQASVSNKKPEVRHIDDPCTSCGNKTLVSLGGGKIYCGTCGRVGDQFPDGDISV